MKAIPKRLPSPAMLVACFALVVSLGGVSYAAGVLPKNSVGSKQLRKGAVKPSKVAPSTIALFKGQTGDPGPKGDPGAQGPKGDPGTPGVSGLEQVWAGVDIGAGLMGGADAICPAGKQAIGGGFQIEIGKVEIKRSRAINQGSISAWRVSAVNAGVTTGTVDSYAYCAIVN
jgi:hypothetical protein